jgi:short-subunit dehydrogenase
MPAFMWLTAEKVAREGYDAVMNGRSVVVNGRIYRFLVWLNGSLPRSLARRVSAVAGRRYRKT